MEILKEKYSITELSEMLSVTDHALRFYEKEFGLTIPKDDRGRRYYTPDLANIMYKIKAMRSEGLEIKAIKKILQSDNVIKEPPPVVSEETQVSLYKAETSSISIQDIKHFFDEFKSQLTSEIASGITTEITSEISGAKDHLSYEIMRSKLDHGISGM